MEKDIEEALERERIERLKRNPRNLKNIKRRKRKNTIIVVILIIIIVLCWIILKDKNSEKIKNEEKEENTENFDTTITNNNNILTDYTNTENVVIEGEKKTNNSNKLHETRDINGMIVSEIDLYALNGKTNFKAKVENKSEAKYDGGIIEIVFLNEDGSEYGRLQGYLLELEIGNTNEINASTTLDLTNAYDFKIEF